MKLKFQKSMDQFSYIHFILTNSTCPMLLISNIETKSDDAVIKLRKNRKPYSCSYLTTK